MAVSAGRVRVTVEGFVRYTHDRLEAEDLASAPRPHTPRRIARAMLMARRGAVRHGILDEIEPVSREAFASMVPLEQR